MAGGHRRRQTLQLEGAHGRELVATRRSRKQPNDLGGEDLSALCSGTEPRRLDDRGAVHVVVFHCHVTGGYPDSDPGGHRRLGGAVVAVDDLLNRHGGRDGVGSGGERGHDAVA